MNDFNLDRLKKIKQINYDIELNQLNYKAKSEKIIILVIFLRNKHTRFLLIEDADIEQSRLFKELSDINKGGEPIEKTSLKNVGFLDDTREKVLNSFKSNIFPLKSSTPETAPDLTVFDHLNQ